MISLFRMPLGASSRLSGGVVILSVSGRATAGAEADALRNHLLDANKHSSRHILLHCEEFAYADSSAIGELVAAYSSVVRGGGMLKLLRPHKRIRQLLQVTNLESVFEIFEDEARAVASFNAASTARGQQSMSAFLKD